MGSGPQDPNPILSGSTLEDPRPLFHRQSKSGPWPYVLVSLTPNLRVPASEITRAGLRPSLPGRPPATIHPLVPDNRCPSHEGTWTLLRRSRRESEGSVKDRSLDFRRKRTQNSHFTKSLFLSSPERAPRPQGHGLSEWEGVCECPTLSRRDAGSEVGTGGATYSPCVPSGPYPLCSPEEPAPPPPQGGIPPLLCRFTSRSNVLGRVRVETPKPTGLD